MLDVVSPTEERVRALVDEFSQTWKRTLDLAVRLGQALEAHKATLDHGQWLPWVESRFPMGERMAQNFMALAANPQEIADLPAGTTVTAAVKWLAEQRRTPRALPEPDSVEPQPMLLMRFCQADLPTSTIVSLILRVAFPDAETALDATYGSGAFWDGSAHVKVTAHDLDPRRAPDGAADFRDLPYDDGARDVVLLDAPHLADAGEDSIMGERFGTASSADLEQLVRDGVCECWRVAKLGIIVKVTDHTHGQRFVAESDWVRDALSGLVPYEVVHQTRSEALIDSRWGEQLSAYSNGSTYLIFRKDGPLHRPRKKGAGHDSD